MSMELSLYDKIENPIQAATELGKAFSRSGMFGCEKEEQGTILALACMAERKTPFEILRTYHIIQGKLSMRADAMLAEFRKRGGKCTWQQHDDKGAKALFEMDKNALTLAFTDEDAKRAGYLPGKAGSGWAKNPGAMMRARLVSMAVRMLCPEAVSGTYTPEEMQDFDTPAPAAAPSIQLEEPKAEKKAKPAKAEKVAEGKVVEEPKPEAKPEPKAEEKPAAPAANGDELAKVKKLLAGHETKANAWFKSKAWTAADGQPTTVDTLPANQIEKILAKPEAFLRAIGAAA